MKVYLSPLISFSDLSRSARVSTTSTPRRLLRTGTLLDQIDDITRNGLVLAPETAEAIGRAEARRNRASTVALWVIAALLAAITWMLV